MSTKLLSIGVLLLSASTVANAATEKVLYFCDYANGIYSYDLDSQDLKLLYESDVNQNVMSITETFDKNIAFSECSKLGECKIKLLSKQSLVTKTIGKGSSIKINGDILLFTTIEKKYNGHVLRTARATNSLNLDDSTVIYGPVEPSRVTVASNGVYYTNKFLNVGETNSVSLYYYDYQTHESIYIDSGLVPIFYSEEDVGLVVFDVADKKNKLVRIPGGNQGPLISLYRNLSGSDWLVVKDRYNLFYYRYSQEWLIFERVNIYGRNILSNNEKLLIENKQLISGFVSD